MADQPDPPDKWRVYEGDDTPDPEPPEAGVFPPPPYAQTPHVPYGSAQTSGIQFTATRSSGPKLILAILSAPVLILVVVIAVAIFAAIAIFAAVDGGVGGIGGIDAKDPDDFADLVDKIEEERGTTEVQDVNFYTDYIIVYMPYTGDPGDDRQISYTWRGGDLEEWTRGTSTDPTFDLKEIDTEVIDGMCDPVLDEADGAQKDDCYVFLSKPSSGDEWFRAFASDDFGRSVYVTYDEDGKELTRTCNSQPC
ncbi:hypothetical protein F0U44_11855 [Nocardioides humilatus]|uniref:Uncharacterized protein n=1 Tax=Nocardioides humilatus TaxID=2607660 RepID=A0A5B1LH67_9ACTN|nr:hypothetical protein [Nocardioides humilatus]KAA1419140.1 hypothetical protein F0U44_11855 [Nocardioides humilatus]